MKQTVRIPAGTYDLPADLEQFNAWRIIGDTQKEDLIPAVQTLVEQSKVRIATNSRMQIVVATLSMMGSPTLRDLDFDRVFVDEAGKASEPKVLLALSRQYRGLYLFGDKEQGGPFVHSVEAKRRGMEVSLFQRVFQHTALEKYRSILETQFRMVPSLYGGLLHSVYPKVQSFRDLAEMLSKVEDVLLKPDNLAKLFSSMGLEGNSLFLHCDSLETTNQRNSKQNFGEVIAAWYVVKYLLEKKIAPQSIKFISFYEAQVASLPFD